MKGNIEVQEKSLMLSFVRNQDIQKTPNPYGVGKCFI